MINSGLQLVGTPGIITKKNPENGIELNLNTTDNVGNTANEKFLNIRSGTYLVLRLSAI